MLKQMDWLISKCKKKKDLLKINGDVYWAKSSQKYIIIICNIVVFF